MKILSVLAFILSLNVAALADEDIWLAKPLAISTEYGLIRYPAGTMLLKEGTKYRVGKDIIEVPVEFITNDPTKIVRTAPVVVIPVRVEEVKKATPAPKPTPAPVVAKPTTPSALQLSRPLGDSYRYYGERK